MRKTRTSIPVNPMAKDFGAGIAIGKGAVRDIRTFGEAELHSLEQAAQSHRDDYHLFFLQEKGTTSIEVDFKKYKIAPSSVIYIRPNQVHRMLAVENVTLSFWTISNENLHPEYRRLLEDITSAKPLSLKKDTFSIISETVALCIKFSERKQERLYHSLLKDSCNALVALVTSQYLQQSKSTDTASRFEIITKAFRSALEHNFSTVKRPAAYAQQLNISTPYLNECVKNTTGYPVSHHIQQRIILEAKRLLYHSDKSIKEIAAELGYDDYTYFLRLFAKIAGMTPSAFRNKNLD